MKYKSCRYRLIGFACTKRIVVIGFLLAIFLTLTAACVIRTPATPSCAGPVIDETLKFVADSASLALSIHGVDCDTVPVLWLHGGPGGAETPLFKIFAGDLEEDRIVVYFDQRGAGRSWEPQAPTGLLTINRHLDDLDHVLDHLRVEYGIRLVALVGHSWGAALGLLYAQAHPEKLAGVVAVNPLIDGLGSQRAQHQFVHQAADVASDDHALRILATIGNPPLDTAAALRLQRLVDRFGGYFHRRPSFVAVLIEAALRDLVGPWEIPKFIRANQVSLDAMNAEILELDLREQVPQIGVPVAVFLGRHDYQTHPGFAVDFLRALKSPDRQIVRFEDSAHNIPFEEAEKFLAALRVVLNNPNWRK